MVFQTFIKSLKAKKKKEKKIEAIPGKHLIKV